MGKLITVIGPSGIGKTALVNAMVKTGKFTVALEQHDQRPFQALFKKDARYSLANQIDYLLLRTEQERRLRVAENIGLIDGGLDLDYHGFTRLFHCRGLLTDPEFDLCQRMYKIFRDLLPLPELIIRMRAEQEIVASRLAARKRINIATPEDYGLFESFLDEWSATLETKQILEVDVTKSGPEYKQLVPNLLAEIKNRLGKI